MYSETCMFAYCTEPAAYGVYHGWDWDHEQDMLVQFGGPGHDTDSVCKTHARELPRYYPSPVKVTTA